MQKEIKPAMVLLKIFIFGNLFFFIRQHFGELVPGKKVWHGRVSFFQCETVRQKQRNETAEIAKLNK